MTSSHKYEKHETLLQLKDISLELGGKPILRNITAEIKNIVRPGMKQGQVVGVLGPSGIGKTQLFRTMAGLQKPTSGQVLINKEGKPVEEGDVGVVFQNYILFRHRKVLGNLVVAARQKGLSKKDAKEKAMALLERFKLADKARFYPDELSGGQKQRVAIAQQLLCSDHFLLMDEPFSGLDPNMISEVCKIIQEDATLDELSTTIVVTHDVSAALAVSDTLWIMGRDHNHDGSVVPGARIVKIWDLIEMGLAWEPDILAKPEFHEAVRTLKLLFREL